MHAYLLLTIVRRRHFYASSLTTAHSQEALPSLRLTRQSPTPTAETQSTSSHLPPTGIAT